MNRIIGFYVELDYDFDGTFTDETENVISFKTERSVSGVDNPFINSSGKVDKAVVTFRNNDSRFSSRVETGDLYSLIGNGKLFMVPIRIGVNMGDSDYRIFTGVCQIPNENPATSTKADQIDIAAYSNEIKYLNNRSNLNIDLAYVWINAFPTDSEAIDYFMVQLGESSYTIDPGIYTVFPYYYDKSIIQILWDIAKACGGFLFTNRLGRFRYYNANHFISTTPLEILDSNSYVNVAMRYNEYDISSGVVVIGQNVTKGRLTELFESTSTYIISPNGDLDIEVNFSSAYNIASITYEAKSFTGVDVSSDITMTYVNSVESSKLSFSSSFAGYTVISKLLIRGYTIEFEQFKVTRESSNSFWTDRSDTKIITKVNGEYLSSISTAESIAELILSNQENPVATLRITQLIYDQPFDLLDLFTVFNNRLSTDAITIIVTKIEYYCSSKGIQCNIEGIDISTLYPYLSSTPSYFILGTNELGNNPLDDIGRLFF